MWASLHFDPPVPERDGSPPTGLGSPGAPCHWPTLSSSPSTPGVGVPPGLPREPGWDLSACPQAVSCPQPRARAVPSQVFVSRRPGDQAPGQRIHWLEDILGEVNQWALSEARAREGMGTNGSEPQGFMAMERPWIKWAGHVATSSRHRVHRTT